MLTVGTPGRVGKGLVDDPLTCLTGMGQEARGFKLGEVLMSPRAVWEPVEFHLVPRSLPRSQTATGASARRYATAVITSEALVATLRGPLPFRLP